MKAYEYRNYGKDNLRLKEVETPTPKDDEILIQVRAVSINDWDWQLLCGIPFVNRMINGLFKPKRRILGSDIAGIVKSTGDKVKHLLVGDEVYGDLSDYWGGFAEYVCAKETYVALKSPSMTFEQAAAVPQAAMLALPGLREVGNLQAGQKLLINGAGGGVGTYAVQLAHLFGVTDVTGVDSADKFEMMRKCGFTSCIDYTQKDFTQNGIKYDLILDTKTTSSIFSYLGSLNKKGIYSTVGGNTSKLFQLFCLGWFIKRLTGKKLQLVILHQNKHLAYINKLFEEGKLESVIDGNYRFDELPKAMDVFGQGKHKGKLVISVQNK